MRLKKAALWFGRYKHGMGILMMLIAGGIPIFLAEMYCPYDSSQNLWPSIAAGTVVMEEGSGDFYKNSIENLAEEEEGLWREKDCMELRTDSGPSGIRFNMAFLFPQNAKGPMDSYGGQVFSFLSEKDTNWKDGIFGLVNQSPASVAGQAGKTLDKVTGAESWGKVRISFYNGDREPVSGYSNVREVLSLASVYAYYHDIQDKETFLNYAQKLWNNSHRYQVSVSDFYYCDGNCLKKEETEDEIFQISEIQTVVSENVFNGTDEASTAPSEIAADLSESPASSQAVLPETAAGPSGPPSANQTIQSETVAGPSGPPLANQTIQPETESGPWSDSQDALPEITEASPAASENVSPEELLSQTDDGKQQDSSLQVQSYITVGPGAPGNEPVKGTEESAEEGIAETTESVEQTILPSETSPSYEIGPESQTPEETGQARKSSQVSDSCQGHWDLTISVYITGMEGTNNLFTKDTIGNREADWTESWQGWDELHQSEAKAIKEQDWYALYGLTIADKTYIRSPLSDGEISYFMGLIPEETSEARRNVVYHALQSVGRIPYYWGGKPSCAGYEGNGFGTVAAPDTEGRVLRGLDCSGWVDWVYWTALGTPFHSGSTAGLMERGQAIERSQLRPGDIILKTGDSSHAFMFLAWTQDGGMYLIHEMGNYTNNVMAGRYQIDWPYYRNLIGD